MARLDDYDYDRMPHGMREYLSYHGYHFSKPMCEFAVSQMRGRNGERISLKTKDEVDTILRNAGVQLKNDKGYDAVFVMHMGLSDYLGSSIPDEMYLAKYVKDVLDDEDGYDGIALTRYLADCSAKGTPIVWEDVI